MNQVVHRLGRLLESKALTAADLEPLWVVPVRISGRYMSGRQRTTSDVELLISRPFAALLVRLMLFLPPAEDKRAKARRYMHVPTMKSIDRDDVSIMGALFGASSNDLAVWYIRKMCIALCLVFDADWRPTVRASARTQ